MSGVDVSGIHREGDGSDDRTILVHLNLSVPRGDTRSADEIADAITDILDLDIEVVDEKLGEITIDVPLAEEI